MNTSTELRTLLERIDHRGYPAYKDTKGVYRFKNYLLSIDHVQGDPFASPSSVSIRVGGREAGFPADFYDGEEKRIALQDHLTRLFGAQAEQYNFKAKGSGKSGLITVSRCGQEILERTACRIDVKTGEICMRLHIGFPANGRTINAGELIRILFDFLPKCVENSLFYRNLDQKRVKQVIELAQDQLYIREHLKERGLCAFVADGSVLPRESGISSRPMKQAVLFQSPESLRVEFELPNRGKITGMGVKEGVTLIVGGGYHGKSTLLEALELGVYNHIAGDGREFVITDASAVKIRAEDSRSVKNVNISMFINHLPNRKDTKRFDTEDASGSTSQAANTVEAAEAGAGLFLIDEDTTATNFMVRDELMKLVVSEDKEPITPFSDRIRDIYEKEHISTVIVAGSSGTYFYKADTVLQMDSYQVHDITKKAKSIAADYKKEVQENSESGEFPGFFADRRPRPDKKLKESQRIKIKAYGMDEVELDRETVDLRSVKQLADPEQVVALGYFLKKAELSLMDGKRTMREIVDELLELTKKEGLESLAQSDACPSLAMPRRQEIFACINRYRRLHF